MMVDVPWSNATHHGLSGHLPHQDQEETLPDHSRERDQAEARFKKAQKATQDAKEARAHYEAEALAVREKTAKLRALRLAKEAADLETRVDKEPRAPKATHST
jgi:hypothetical protein